MIYLILHVDVVSLIVKCTVVSSIVVGVNFRTMEETERSLVYIYCKVLALVDIS